MYDASMTLDASLTADRALAELMAADRTPPLERRPTLQKVRYTHEDCINRILAEPTISQNDLAAIYGYTASWMSIVVNSDAFQSRLAERRQELVDPVLVATINERFRALTVRSLEVLQEKLSQPVERISDKLALEAAALGARSLGIGSQPTTPQSGADHLASLAHRLLDLQAGRRTEDAEVVDVPARRVA